MKVYIICREPFPNGMASTNRIICYAKALIREGIGCTVLIFSRTEKKGDDRNPLTEGEFEGVPFRYIGRSTVKPLHKIPRLLCKYSDQHGLKVFLNDNLEKGDIVIGYPNAETRFLCGVIDIVHTKGARYVRELCEIPYLGSTRKKDEKGLQTTLTGLFPKCDGFLAISGPLEKLAEQYKSANAKILRIPILVDYDKYMLPDLSEEAQVPFIFHSGTLYERKDGILGMIKAFGKATASTGMEYKMILAGELSQSPDKDQILSEIRSHNLEDKVVFTGFLQSDQVKEYLSKASLVVINKQPNKQNEHGFSTKLGEYLAAGKAIVTTDFGEAMNYLRNDENAWVVRRNDSDALAEAIIRAFQDKEGRKRIGESGRELCKKCFDYRGVSSKLARFLKEL